MTNILATISPNWRSVSQSGAGWLNSKSHHQSCQRSNQSGIWSSIVFGNVAKTTTYFTTCYAHQMWSCDKDPNQPKTIDPTMAHWNLNRIASHCPQQFTQTHHQLSHRKSITKSTITSTPPTMNTTMNSTTSPFTHSTRPQSSTLYTSTVNMQLPKWSHLVVCLLDQYPITLFKPIAGSNRGCSHVLWEPRIYLAHANILLKFA